MRRVNGAHEGVQTGGDWGIIGGQGISGAIGVGIRAGLYRKCHAYEKEGQTQYSRRQGGRGGFRKTRKW